MKVGVIEMIQCYCVLTSSDIYKRLARVKEERDSEGLVAKNILGYKLAEGERLLKSIAQASVAHIIDHTTYCNHLFEWIRRADAAELAGITYGAELPDDLAAHMQEILTQAGAVAETEAVT